MHGRLEKKGLKTEVRDKLGGRSFPADPEQLRVALTNLMTNASQASSWSVRIRRKANQTSGLNQCRICNRDTIHPK